MMKEMKIQSGGAQALKFPLEIPVSYELQKALEDTKELDLDKHPQVYICIYYGDLRD